MKRILRYISIILVLALGVVGVVTLVQEQRRAGAQEQASEVLDEAIVERGSLRVTIGATSTVSPARQVSLRFALTGIIAEVYVSEGQAVAAGDPIARMEAGQLQSALRDAELLRDIRQIALDALLAPPRPEDIAAAQAALDVAQAQLNAAYDTSNPQAAEIARIQAELARNALWQAQLQRDLAVNPPSVTVSQDVPGMGTVTQEYQPPGADPDQFAPGLEQAEYGVEIADAQASAAANTPSNVGSVASANAAIVAAQTALDRLANGPSELDVQMAQIELAQAQAGVELAQANLDNAVLTAPFDGVIAELDLSAGELPPVDGAAVLLIDGEGFYLDLPVDETDIAQIQLGQPVEIELDALPDVTLTGVITRTPVLPMLGAGQVVTYVVRVTLDPTSAMVRAGMTSTATIIVNQLEDALILPNRFIRIDRVTGQAFVTIATDDGGYQVVPVTLGVRNETQSEILAGLSEGQHVVLLPNAIWNPVAASAENGGGQPRR